MFAGHFKAYLYEKKQQKKPPFKPKIEKKKPNPSFVAGNSQIGDRFASFTYTHTHTHIHMQVGRKRIGC